MILPTLVLFESNHAYVCAQCHVLSSCGVIFAVATLSCICVCVCVCVWREDLCTEVFRLVVQRCSTHAWEFEFWTRFYSGKRHSTYANIQHWRAILRMCGMGFKCCWTTNLKTSVYSHACDLSFYTYRSWLKELLPWRRWNSKRNLMPNYEGDVCTFDVKWWKWCGWRRWGVQSSYPSLAKGICKAYVQHFGWRNDKSEKPTGQEADEAPCWWRNLH